MVLSTKRQHRNLRSHSVKVNTYLMQIRIVHQSQLETVIEFSGNNDPRYAWNEISWGFTVNPRSLHARLETTPKQTRGKPRCG